MKTKTSTQAKAEQQGLNPTYFTDIIGTNITGEFFIHTNFGTDKHIINIEEINAFYKIKDIKVKKIPKPRSTHFLIEITIGSKTCTLKNNREQICFFYKELIENRNMGMKINTDFDKLCVKVLSSSIQNITIVSDMDKKYMDYCEKYFLTKSEFISKMKIAEEMKDYI